MENIFQGLFTASDYKIPLVGFLVNLVSASVLSLVLSELYKRYGNSLSNRAQFANNFVILSLTTVLIITIIKTSLALSLGLVGALSIIRFRAAIKEPEELTFLFIAIAIGLGFGANQGIATTTAFIFICFIIYLKSFKQRVNNDGMNLLISSDNKDLVVDELIEIINTECRLVRLRRLDKTKSAVDLSFSVEFDSYNSLVKLKDKLKDLDANINFTFLDNSGIID